MKTNNSPRKACGAAVGVLALLALTTGTALAQAPATTAYNFSSHPMISGTVVSVNDRQMVVNTDQGEQVTLQVDSRTMAPRDFGPGMVMRAEFLALEDCRFYAQRIMPIRSGMSPNRLQAYANTTDSREAVARSNGTYGDYRVTSSESGSYAGSQVSTPQRIDAELPGRTMNATHTTSDFQFSSGPMVAGRVLTVNDHRLVVQTNQGQLIGMVMDSRTMTPRDLAPGSDFRAEFTQLDDGRYYAKRITRIESDLKSREQAYAHTRDADIALANTVSDCGYVAASTANTQSSVVEPPARVARPVAQYTPPPAAEPVEAPETLPQTASNQPLILMLGLFAFAAAGIVAVTRRLRTA